jgi:hypothetical protein
MDLGVLLDQAQAALTKQAFRSAHLALRDYWRWRDAGGFEPCGGDQRAVWLRLAFEVQVRPRSWFHIATSTYIAATRERQAQKERLRVFGYD